jgi:hypothetical protein
LSPASAVPPTPTWRVGMIVRLAVGALLVVVGAVLWIKTGTTAYGLVSGLGVVIAYLGAEPWIERWRNS